MVNNRERKWARKLEDQFKESNIQLTRILDRANKNLREKKLIKQIIVKKNASNKKIKRAYQVPEKEYNLCHDHISEHQGGIEVSKGRKYYIQITKNKNGHFLTVIEKARKHKALLSRF